MTFSFLTPLLFCFIALSSSASIGVESFTGYPIAPISSLISKNLYDTIFLHKDDTACPAKNFYPYQSFIEASKYFPQFGTTGCLATRKREIAAFLAQISHETTGGWATAPDGPFSWGLCFKEEISPQSNYCDSTDKDWPCFEGKSYKGRGPIQLSWYTLTTCKLLIIRLNYYLVYYQFFFVQIHTSKLKIFSMSSNSICYSVHSSVKILDAEF